MVRPEGYPSPGPIEASTSTSASSNAQNWAFLGQSNDISLLESGLLHRNLYDMAENCSGFEATPGKPVDLRLLSLLEYFRELFVQRREVFMKICPAGLHDEIAKLFEKFDAAKLRVKSDRMKVLQRSLSIGSPRPMSQGGDQEPLTLEYFKVRTVHTDDGSQKGRPR
ncbi:hypothetical protein CJ030_MR1G015657 [Morella rubra]|uniref:Uncharacterized protein n=1 Tax=Morella rubra TaxID=262757 RepID=A0A6A1WNC6_9ROSI|nr:hypothetical protein CJ030_MR1G015657 [Morella rubra]